MIPRGRPGSFGGPAGPLHLHLQAQVSVPAVHDDRFLLGAPGEGVDVLLPNVPLDGAELERGQGAPTHHADHAVPRRVEIHQVFRPPMFVVIPPMVPPRNPAFARPGSSCFAMVRVFAPSGQERHNGVLFGNPSQQAVPGGMQETSGLAAVLGIGGAFRARGISWWDTKAQLHSCNAG